MRKELPGVLIKFVTGFKHLEHDYHQCRVKENQDNMVSPPFAWQFFIASRETLSNHCL